MSLWLVENSADSLREVTLQLAINRPEVLTWSSFFPGYLYLIKNYSETGDSVVIEISLFTKLNHFNNIVLLYTFIYLFVFCYGYKHTEIESL